METNKKFFISMIASSVLLSALTGGFFGFWAGRFSLGSDTGFFGLSGNAIGGEQAENQSALPEIERIVKVSEESAVISVVEKVSPAVVSIIVTKDLPVIERYNQSPFSSDFFSRFFGSDFDDLFGTPAYRQNGTQRIEVAGGTGFIVSADGYIVTNKHVVSDDTASYTVLMNDESKYEARVLARDTYNDVAILKIEQNNLPFVEMGNSMELKVGQSVVTIGNSLGEFRNTVSTGVISGLARNVTAGGRGVRSEELLDAIQTDAAINPGNSGGPLLDISGRAIGINTAIAQGAENIGFAIPINSVRSIYESVRQYGKIVKPWLGVRYIVINEAIARENGLARNEGALIAGGETREEVAIIPGSPADKGGLKEGDIILEINNEKISTTNPLARIISKYQPGAEIELRIFRGEEEQTIKIKLEEMQEM
jgi:serine protease Do